MINIFSRINDVPRGAKPRPPKMAAQPIEVANPKSPELIKLEYLKAFAQLRYDYENHRSDSLLDQAGKLQTGFAFLSAALFATAPVVVAYKGPAVSYELLLAAYITISFFLLHSLFFAVKAQERKDLNRISDVETITDALNKCDDSKLEITLLQKWIDTIDSMTDSIFNRNEIMKDHISVSLKALLWSLWSILCWTIVIVLTMLIGEGTFAPGWNIVKLVVIIVAIGYFLYVIIFDLVCLFNSESEGNHETRQEKSK